MSHVPAMLAALKSDLLDCIASNRAAGGDRVDRVILGGLSDRARRYVRIINAEEERGSIGGWFGTSGYFGPNGHGPAIRDIIRQSEWHRRRIIAEAHARAA